jgi:hypothetical protein
MRVLGGLGVLALVLLVVGTAQAARSTECAEYLRIDEAPQWSPGGNEILFLRRHVSDCPSGGGISLEFVGVEADRRRSPFVGSWRGSPGHRRCQREGDASPASPLLLHGAAGVVSGWHPHRTRHVDLRCGDRSVAGIRNSDDGVGLMVTRQSTHCLSRSGRPRSGVRRRVHAAMDRARRHLGGHGLLVSRRCVDRLPDHARAEIREARRLRLRRDARRRNPAGLGAGFRGSADLRSGG